MTDSNLSHTRIEEEWARYKYYVMSKSAAIYVKIRKIMNEHNLKVSEYSKIMSEHNLMTSEYSKIACNDSKLMLQSNAYINEQTRETALLFYKLIEKAQKLPEDKGAQINAAQHVWGYMKKTCAPKDKVHFQTLLSDYDSGKKSIQSVKSFLFRETNNQAILYLQKSHYFYF
jgi:UV DNA damage endonuclease